MSDSAKGSIVSLIILVGFLVGSYLGEKMGYKDCYDRLKSRINDCYSISLQNVSYNVLYNDHYISVDAMEKDLYESTYKCIKALK